MKKLIGIIALLVFISFAHAEDEYVVSTKIYDNEKLISAPTLIVNSNQEASISVDDLYSFALTVTPVNDTTINITSVLDISGQHLSPSLLVEIGKEASINIDGKELSVVVNKWRS